MAVLSPSHFFPLNNIYYYLLILPVTLFFFLPSTDSAYLTHVRSNTNYCAILSLWKAPRERYIDWGVVINLEWGYLSNVFRCHYPEQGLPRGGNNFTALAVYELWNLVFFFVFLQMEMYLAVKHHKKQLMGDAALAAPVLGSYPQPLGSLIFLPVLHIPLCRSSVNFNAFLSALACVCRFINGHWVDRSWIWAKSGVFFFGHHGNPVLTLTVL